MGAVAVQVSPRMVQIRLGESHPLSEGAGVGGQRHRLGVVECQTAARAFVSATCPAAGEGPVVVGWGTAYVVVAVAPPVAELAASTRRGVLSRRCLLV